MKITAQEEYGLRILIRIASCERPEGMSIPQLSEAEGLSTHYVAKLTRFLRLSGYINSTPGYKGGYILSRPAHEIMVAETLKTLGGALFDEDFCGAHSGSMRFCNHSVDCSVRSLWQMIQLTFDKLLEGISLENLINPEKSIANDLFFRVAVGPGDMEAVGPAPKKAADLLESDLGRPINP